MLQYDERNIANVPANHVNFVCVKVANGEQRVDDIFINFIYLKKKIRTI